MAEEIAEATEDVDTLALEVPSHGGEFFLEIGGRLLTLFMPLQGMYRTQRNRMFDSYLYTRRRSYLVDIVSRKNTLQLIRGIRKGVPTWYAPDQDFRRERNVLVPSILSTNSSCWKRK